MKLNIQLASPPDRNRLVAEIFEDNQQIVEVSWEEDKPMLEIYPKPDPNSRGIWRIELDSFIEALSSARQRLDY